MRRPEKMKISQWRVSLFGLTFSLLTLSACSLYQVNTEMLTYDIYPAKSSINDVAYVENVSRPYILIGRITVNAERHQKMESVINRLKMEAAKLGGDAITNIRMNSGNGTWARIKPKNLFGNANIRTNFIADVIVYKNEASASQQTPEQSPTTQEENLK